MFFSNIFEIIIDMVKIKYYRYKTRHRLNPEVIQPVVINPLNVSYDSISNTSSSDTVSGNSSNTSSPPETP